jgi:predicted flap endonuclease-1-like 5' DNA nuclease
MLEIASQMILCLLLAALLGFIIGYLFGKGTCASDDCGHTEDTHHDDSHDTHAVVTTTTNDKPELLSAPRNGKKDNLTRIKGVGVKIEESLNGIGIYHFDQIAAWDTENIAWADSTLGFPGRAQREEWVAQAKALDAGEETEFSKRVDAGEVSTSKQA